MSELANYFRHEAASAVDTSDGPIDCYPAAVAPPGDYDDARDRDANGFDPDPHGMLHPFEIEAATDGVSVPLSYFRRRPRLTETELEEAVAAYRRADAIEAEADLVRASVEAREPREA